MHATLVLSGIWLWLALPHARPVAAVAGGLVTAAQMGALSALLTSAPCALSAAHEFSTLPWNLSPLEVQQLGGLLM